MSLLARIPVPVEADYTVRKIVLTDRYLVTGTATGWTATLDFQTLRDGAERDTSQRHKIFQADPWWDIDCREDTIATTNANGTITLWDAPSSSRKADLTGHTALAKVVVLPPDRQTVISGSRDTNIIVWDTQTYQPRSTFTEHQKRISLLKVFDSILVSASDGGMVCIWDLNTDTCLHKLQAHGKIALVVNMSEDKSLLVTGTVDGEMKIWDLKTGTFKLCHGHTGHINHLSNAPNNIFLSAATDGTIRAWDWTTGQNIRTLDAHDGQCVRGVVLTDSFMISAGHDGGLHFWDRDTWQLRFDLHKGVGATYHPVGRDNLLAVALLISHGEGPEDYHTVVELWDLNGLEEGIALGNINLEH